MIPLPNLRAAFVNKFGNLVSPWNSYLQQFTQAPPNIATVIVGASPITYTATEPGTVIISGGTLTALTLTRGLVTVALAITDRIIPVGINDIVVITYSIAPIAIKFVPSFGQNTNG